MSLTLEPIPRRVLGVLIEKSMTQPDAYPMTLNAIVLACNQKQNRDPVMNLAEGDVGAAIYALQQWGLVSQADTGPGSRSNRFRHQVEAKLGWGTRERAVLAELLLRGPQTPGELRTRAARMTPLESVPFVLEMLNELERHDPPFARALSRAPGQSATRYAHTLYPPDEPIPTVGPVVMEVAGTAPRAGGAFAGATSGAEFAADQDAEASPGGSQFGDERWRALEARVASLEAVVRELQSQAITNREGKE